MLGDKKSEEPYSPDDVSLLQAIAMQIGAARETGRLKDRVEEDRRIRHDVLAHLETGHVTLLKECPACGACYDAPATTCAADGAELQLSLPVERTINRSTGSIGCSARAGWAPSTKRPTSGWRGPWRSR